jgi:imidazolonepropionase-like amidohydrolase
MQHEPILFDTWKKIVTVSTAGPDVLMIIAHPAMRLLKEHGYDENAILALLTINPAKMMGKEDRYGSLAPGMEANLLVAEGVPGLEITEVKQIKEVYFRGVKVIQRL